ncbi:MAG: hypothetical protein JW395_0853 [Nitrospira sp.]|nr:hypothetical protein [Nitrospira sp.]
MAGVTTQHEEYKELAPRWKRCRDAVAGSDAIKKAGIEYLPMLDSHHANPLKYTEFKQRALFYNAAGRTVAGLAGGIFQKAPTVSEVDEKTLEHTKDVTLNGEPLESFALKTTQEYLTTGRYGILVDMASEEAVESRPYWVGYRAEDIINWRFNKMGGDQELVLVVLREGTYNLNVVDEFEAKPVTQFRVLRLTPEGVYTQQVYTQEEQKAGDTEIKYAAGPVLIPTRRAVPLDFIPFALPWAVNTPPILDLVDINIAHYRGGADLKHGLHFTALPTPWVSGQSGDNSKPLHIGSGTAWSLEKDGKAGMLEFTGKGLEAIRTDLQDMQKMMATLGARLLEEVPSNRETALSVSMRHGSDYATLRTMAQIVEQQLSWALKVHQWWVGNEALVSNMRGNLELNKTFFDQHITADELRALLLALQSNSISYKTFYARLSATGWMR